MSKKPEIKFISADPFDMLESDIGDSPEAGIEDPYAKAPRNTLQAFGKNNVGANKFLSSQEIVKSIRSIDLNASNEISHSPVRYLETPDPCPVLLINNSNHNKALLTKEDPEFNSDRARHSYACECNICIKNSQNLQALDKFEHFDDCDTSIDQIERFDYLQSYAQDDIRSDDRDFSFILRRLQPIKMSTGNKKTIKLYIPDTIVFDKGEIKLIVEVHQKKHEKDRN